MKTNFKFLKFYLHFSFFINMMDMNSKEKRKIG
jgi:hypothetical protein